MKERSKEWAVRACRDFATLRQLMAFPPQHKNTLFFLLLLSSPPLPPFSLLGRFPEEKKIVFVQKLKGFRVRKEQENQGFRWAPLIDIRPNHSTIQWYQTNCIYSPSLFSLSDFFLFFYFIILFFFIFIIMTSLLRKSNASRGSQKLISFGALPHFLFSFYHFALLFFPLTFFLTNLVRILPKGKMDK